VQTNGATSDFARDGAVLIRGVLSADEIARLTQGIETNLAQPGPLAALASDAADPGRFVEDFCNWQRISEYEQTLRNSALPALAAALMKSTTARIYHDHFAGEGSGHTTAHAVASGSAFL